MSRIQKRTCEVRNAIHKEWYDKYWQFIIDNPDKPWDWDYISENPNITMKDILDNPDKPWDWDYISWNPNIFSPTHLSFLNVAFGINHNFDSRLISSKSRLPWPSFFCI